MHLGILGYQIKGQASMVYETAVLVDCSNRVEDQVSFTRILRYCKYCEKETPHEARIGPDGSSEVCIRCRELALMEELDPD
jgi:hypothetical protein